MGWSVLEEGFAACKIDKNKLTHNMVNFTSIITRTTALMCSVLANDETNDSVRACGIHVEILL